jgi:chondroitin AC lyase
MNTIPERRGSPIFDQPISKNQDPGEISFLFPEKIVRMKGYVSVAADRASAIIRRLKKASGVHRFGTVFSILFFVATTLSAKQSSLTIGEEKTLRLLTDRLISRSLTGAPSGNGFPDLLRSDGSWSDIRYEDSTALTPYWMEHLRRLRALAVAYRTPGGTGYGSPELLDKLDKGFAYIHRKPLKAVNWWFLTIGGPNEYMAALMLLKGKLSEQKIQAYSAAYLRDVTANQAHRGQNRVWVSVITIYKGCLENNFELVNKAFRSIASTLVIEPAQGNEGIKIDNSFHQHRSQIYSGGYGLGFVKGVAEFIALSADTDFGKAFSPANRQVLSDLVLKGNQLLSFRNVTDFGTIGREITRQTAMHGVDTALLHHMQVADPAHAADYRQWSAHLAGAPYPAAYRGNRYFWKSDMMTQHGAGYYLSAKVPSTRTVGTEMLNGENSKGYYLPLGATNIMTSGKEYKGIFPVWDWTRIPGTTAMNNQASASLGWYLYGSNRFSGAISDGTNGFMAYEHSYNGVEAKKAYFFFGNAMLCMGAGIKASAGIPVQTTINQSALNGEINLYVDDRKDALRLGTRVLKTAARVFHDSIGYVIPGGQTLNVSGAALTGSWRSANLMEADEPVSKDVFTLWINHGNAPGDAGYEYLVIPAISREAFERNRSADSIRVIRNTEAVQAVSFGDKTAVVFYEPGSIALPDGTMLTTDKKALILLTASASGYRVAVSDPLQREKEVHISVRRPGTGKKAGPSRTFLLQFPQGDLAGTAAIHSP